MPENPRTTLFAEFDARPRKARPAEIRSSSESTHKIRSAWFQARESWPYREAPVDLLNRERARFQLEIPQATPTAAWTPVGPANIGGRMTSVISHPTQPEQVWAGAAGGGIWHSPDAGKSWQSLWHAEPTLNIGALAIDPQQPDTMYCGTGEANLSADSHPGVGLFRSLNAGASWQLLADSDGSGLPRRIGALAVDPFDSNRLLAGGVTHSPDSPSGLYLSIDAGMTWGRVPFVGGNSYRCHDVRFR